MVVEVQSCWPPHLPKCQASPKAQDSRPRTARSLNGAFGHANQSNSAVRVLVPVQQTWLSPRCEMMFLAILLQVLGGIHWGRDTIEAVWVSEGICSSTKHQSPHLGIDAATHLFTSVSFRHFSFAGSRQPGSRLFQSTGLDWRPTTEYTPPAKGNTGRKWICAGYGNFLWIFLTNWGPSPLGAPLVCVLQTSPMRVPAETHRLWGAVLLGLVTWEQKPSPVTSRFGWAIAWKKTQPLTCLSCDFTHGILCHHKYHPQVIGCLFQLVILRCLFFQRTMEETWPQPRPAREQVSIKG